MSGRPTLSRCLTCTGYHTSMNSIRVFRESAAGIAPTGKMRPSMPMSPTCALFGIPPRATTAQFSNPNGGYLRSSSSVFGKSRTTNPRPIAQSFSSSLSPQSFFSRVATTRQAVGEKSIPTHCRFNFLRCDQRRSATAKSIEHNVVFVAACFDDSFQQHERLLRRVSQILAERRRHARSCKRVTIHQRIQLRLRVRQTALQIRPRFQQLAVIGLGNEHVRRTELYDFELLFRLVI